MYKANDGITLCKSFNATLPLPKSANELTAFQKITGTLNVWIGITDETKSGKKEKWKDVEGNEIGNAFVNLRVRNRKFFNYRNITFKLKILTVFADPLETVGSKPTKQDWASSVLEK